MEQTIFPSRTPKEVIAQVEEFLKIPVGGLESPSRLRFATDARSIVAFYLRNYCAYTLEEIAVAMNRNHSSVIHMLNKHKSFYSMNKDYRDSADRVFKYLNTSDKDMLRRQLTVELVTIANKLKLLESMP